jgi:hypothetical protein
MKVFVAVIGIIWASLGPGPAVAYAEPDEGQLAEIAVRNAENTCDEIADLPNEEGVRRAIADVLDKTELPRSLAARVVGLGVTRSCPQYLPQVHQAIPNFP